MKKPHTNTHTHTHKKKNSNKPSDAQDSDTITIYALVAVDKETTIHDVISEWRTLLTQTYQTQTTLNQSKTSIIQPYVYAVSPDKVGINIDAVYKDAVVALLAQHARTRWVERRPRFILKNKHSCKIVQSGDATATLMWNRGLRGEGEIVGVADTGIDHDSCFFRYDPVMYVCIYMLICMQIRG
jgi:hypothetical protein